MSTSRPRHSDGRKRGWLIAVAAVLSAAAAVLIAVATSGLGLLDSEKHTPSKESTSQQRCESEVLNRMATPSRATLANVKAEISVLDPDSRDLFSLTIQAPLKGVEHSRITVWNVSGVVDTQTEMGTTLHDGFDCRAYFVDDELVHTLVLFSHDH